MNKEILNIKFSEYVVIESIDYDGIKFSDGSVLRESHDQATPENAYADWKQIIDSVNGDLVFDTLNIRSVVGTGLMLSFNDFKMKQPPVLVPCYNELSGYYSSELLITYTSSKDYEEVNASEAVEDRIKG